MGAGDAVIGTTTLFGILIAAAAAGAGPTHAAAAVPARAPAASAAADSLAGGPFALAAAPDSVSVPLAAAVETRLDSVVHLPEVVVERDRVGAARRRRPTGFVTELRTADAVRGYASVADLLERAAGVHVVRQGGLGAFTSVSLRGAPAGQVAVYVDGLPMQSAAHSVVDLAELPMAEVQSVEIYRGGAPLSLGPGRPGGAIQLVTGPPRGVMLSLARGSFDTWEANAGAGARFGALAASVHGGYQGSDGDYPYLNDNGTPFNAADDVEAARRNNRFDRVSGGVRLAWQPDPRWRVQATGEAQRQAQGFPGLGSVPAANARARLLRGSAQLAAARLFADEGRIEASAMLQRDRRRFEDALGQLGFARHRTDDRFGAEQMALRAMLPRRAGVQLEGGLALRLERAAPTDALDGRPDPPPSNRRTSSAETAANWQPSGGPLLLVAAQRWDRVDDRLRSAGTSGATPRVDAVRETRAPQLGARLRLPGGLELRGNWSSAERMPDFLEFFGDQGGVAGNPSLRPERVESRDAGLAWAGRVAGRWRGTLEYARFASSGEDFIVFVRTQPTAMQAQNISRAKIRGEELSASLDLPFGFAAAGATTWQSARDDGAVPFWRGRDLPQRPGRESSARLAWRGFDLEASLETRHQSESWRDRANQHRVPGRTILDAAIGWAPGVWPARIVLEGRNLDDIRATDVAGYPLPGRSFLVSLHWQAGRERAAD